MLELVIVVSLMLIVLAFAIIQLGPNLQIARSNTAMRQVLDQMRQAREYSIERRRYIQISFPVVGSQYQVQIQQMNTMTAGAGGVNPILSTVPIQAPLQFFVYPATPDTPDGFGNNFAICFGGLNGGPPSGMLFQSDGELVDGAALLPISGTVFIGNPSQPSSLARAVTVMGSTGRVRGWKFTGPGWIQF
jgi:type II secretory pathway pseudopilin PulG